MIEQRALCTIVLTCPFESCGSYLANRVPWRVGDAQSGAGRHRDAPNGSGGVALACGFHRGGQKPTGGRWGPAGEGAADLGVAWQDSLSPLARALEIALADPERSQEMGLAGKQRIAEVFDSSKQAEQQLQLYEQVLAAQRGGQASLSSVST